MGQRLPAGHAWRKCRRLDREQACIKRRIFPAGGRELTIRKCDAVRSEHEGREPWRRTAAGRTPLCSRREGDNVDLKIEMVGVDRVLENFRSLLPQQIRFSALQAVDRTADKTQARLYSEMHRVFDRPTRYTLGALRTKRPSMADLTAEVGFKEPWAPRSTKYLTPQVEGGSRRVKAFEKMIQQRVTIRNPQGGGRAYPAGTMFVPGRGARMNAYGNISPGQIQQILSGLKAQSDRYQNETAPSRKRAKRTSRYWATSRGIWLIEGQKMTMVLVVVKAKPQYAKRYDFYELANSFARSIFENEFAVALSERTVR